MSERKTHRSTIGRRNQRRKRVKRPSATAMAWMGYDVYEVVSPQGWQKNPQLVLDFTMPGVGCVRRIAQCGPYRTLPNWKRILR